MNMEYIIFGLIPWRKANAFLNTIILVYKFLLFKFRNEGNPSLHLFKLYLKDLQSVEYKVALHKNKIDFHLFKWDACLDELRSLGEN